MTSRARTLAGPRRVLAVAVSLAAIFLALVPAFHFHAGPGQDDSASKGGWFCTLCAVFFSTCTEDASVSVLVPPSSPGDLPPPVALPAEEGSHELLRGRAPPARLT